MFAIEKYGYAPTIDEVLDTFMPAGTGTGWTSNAYSPATDVVEGPEGYVLELDLPGLTEKDVQVTVESNRLLVAGERKAPQKEGYTRMERSFGRFERVFNLPDDVDTAHIDAKASLPDLEKAVVKAGYKVEHH